MKTTVYNTQGKEAGSIDLPETIFDLPMNNELVHQVYVSLMSNRRAGTAHTKTRDEVRGGGKKPWQQKGTGRARHGSIRSPIWRGGGITHGPRTERNWDKKVNKKMRDKALFIVLSQKLRDNEIIFVDSFEIQEPQTAFARKALDALSGIADFAGLNKKKNAALVAQAEHNTALVKSFANMGHVTTEEMRKLNIVDLLTNKYVIIINPQESLATLESKLA